MEREREGERTHKKKRKGLLANSLFQKKEKKKKREFLFDFVFFYHIFV